MRLRPDQWLLGLPLLAVLWGVAVWRIAPEVEGRLRLRLGAELQTAADSPLRRSGGRVEIEGRDLSVTADTRLEPDAQAEVERLATGIAGLRRYVLRFVAPASAKPFSFAVRRAGRELVLSGFVPPGDLRSELLTSAREGGKPVRDDLRSALGAPEQFEDAARTVLAATRNLEAASATIEDGVVTIRGTAPDSTAYRAASGLGRRLPAGFQATVIAVTPPEARPFRWSATRDRRALVLGGNVPSEAERTTLVAAAGEAYPGTAIEDRMETARGLESGIDFTGVGRTALGFLARLDEGQVDLSGRGLSLAGRLAARDLLPAVEAELANARVPGIELGRPDLRAIPASPYRFAAARKSGRLGLSGFLPSEADRATLRQLVQRRFPFDSVRDDLHIADGAPDGMAAVAQRALERLATLGEGEAAIQDLQVRLVGRSPYAEQAERVARDARTDVPSGWSGSVEIATGSLSQKPLDPGFCEDLVSDVVRGEPLRFEPGKAELSAVGHKALAGVADVMRRCGPATLTVVAGVETAGELGPARDLAEGRAAGVSAVLRELGVRGAAHRASATKVQDASGARDVMAFEVGP